MSTLRTIAVAVALLVGCVIAITLLLNLPQYDPLTASSFPGWITGFTSRHGVHMIAPGDELCLHIQPERIWQPGDYWTSFGPEVEITIDHRPVTDFVQYVKFSQVLRHVQKYDQGGNLIGAYGGTLDYCLDLTIRRGGHVMKIEIIPPGRDAYEYYLIFHAG